MYSSRLEQIRLCSLAQTGNICNKDRLVGRWLLQPPGLQLPDCSHPRAQPLSQTVSCAFAWKLKLVAGQSSVNFLDTRGRLAAGLSSASYRAGACTHHGLSASRKAHGQCKLWLWSCLAFHSCKLSAMLVRICSGTPVITAQALW